MDFNTTLTDYAAWIDSSLAQFLPGKDCRQQRLIEAMEYSLLSGGKRLRGALLLEMYRLHGGEVRHAMPFACGLEMVHAYSLIHDDLPCMDDDDLRRGKPTNHKVYGEAVAVLAGDGLLNRAFEIMSTTPHFSADITLKAMNAIAGKTGVLGMIGGQVLDMALEGERAPCPQLHEAMVNLKTGALFEAACGAGCILAGCSPEVVDKAILLGRLLGAMFQLSDDMLDVTGTDEALGKPVGSDAQQGKCTYTTLYGLAQCRVMLENMVIQAGDMMKAFPHSVLLSGLAQWMGERQS